MSINIKIESGAFNLKVKKFEAGTIKTIADELNRFGTKTVADAKRLVPFDEGLLARSISHTNATPQKLSVGVVVAANYGAYLEFGTRKFAAQYVASLPPLWQQYAASFKGKSGGSYNDFILRITDWVKRKGIAKGDDTDQIAYLIARKILREGIRPQPFLFPAVQKNLIELKNRLK